MNGMEVALQTDKQNAHAEIYQPPFGGALGVNTRMLPAGNTGAPGGGPGNKTRGMFAPVSAGAPGGRIGVRTRTLPSTELMPGGGSGPNT